jgi:anti-anti-sigma factor
VNSPLELSTRQDDHGNQVLSATGEIDMSNAADFRDALAQAATTAPQFTVDLTAVDYLDSAGLTALLPHAARIKIIASTVLAPVLAPVLSVSGLDAITTVIPAP